MPQTSHRPLILKTGSKFTVRTRLAFQNSFLLPFTSPDAFWLYKSSHSWLFLLFFPLNLLTSFNLFPCFFRTSGLSRRLKLTTFPHLPPSPAGCWWDSRKAMSHWLQKSPLTGELGQVKGVTKGWPGSGVVGWRRHLLFTTGPWGCVLFPSIPTS